MTTTLLSPVSLSSVGFRYALKKAMENIRNHGAIEDTQLAALVEAEGCSDEDAGWALSRIIDNVQDGLWVAELGRLPVAILSAVTADGEESWAYVYLG